MAENDGLYTRVVVAAGNIIAVSAVVGSHLEDPRFESIREAWEEKIEGVIKQLDDTAEELTLFGEAYDEDDT